MNVLFANEVKAVIGTDIQANRKKMNEGGRQKPYLLIRQLLLSSG